jgi:hypothetical protein
VSSSTPDGAWSTENPADCSPTRSPLCGTCFGGQGGPTFDISDAFARIGGGSTEHHPSAVLFDDLDQAHDVAVELGQVVSWDPVLEDRFAADLVLILTV